MAVYRTLKQLEKDGELQSEWNTSGSGPAIRILSADPGGVAEAGVVAEDIKSPRRVFSIL